MKPREKAKSLGIASLEDSELLALLLKSGYQNKDVYALAQEVIEKAGGLDHFLTLTYEELIAIKGIKEAKAFEILAVLEITRRILSLKKKEKIIFNEPMRVVEWLRLKIALEPQENFIVIYLNHHHEYLKDEILFKGTANSALVSISEILRRALLYKAYAIIIGHNHPSDDCKPSGFDLELTSQLKEACYYMQIQLLDHIIISRSHYYSFRMHDFI